MSQAKQPKTVAYVSLADNMPNHKQFRAARKYGYRSGLEHKLSLYLDELKISYDYEKLKIGEDLAYRTYTPDFVLDNGIIIETKGMFTAADRQASCNTAAAFKT
ncbi:MAG: hypothetical protein CM15mV148_280 [uncultured marine virus]|nr:MAG: hypothetical protein CM15mV148_280 [uncultured marine virus]